MSVVDFSQHSAAMAARAIAPLLHGELDGLLASLSQAERRDVRDMLDAVARNLAKRSDDAHGMRQRLDAMIAALIGVADAIDGDCDMEPNCGTTSWYGNPSDDECEPAADDEPSLGWSGRGPQPCDLRNCLGGYDQTDLEGDNSDLELTA